MNGEDATAIGDPPRRRFATYVLVALFCFLLGLAAMAWLLAHWQGGASLLGVAQPGPALPSQAAPQQPAPVASSPAGTLPAPAPSAAADGAEQAQRVIIDPELSRRVAALEQRMDDIDLQSRAAVGNADRAEGLLVAFAARRALDRGVRLGFLEGLLRQRFGRTQPRAVGMIILASQNPVTLQELQLEFHEVAPSLVGPGPDAGWWEALRAELGSLITVRRADTPSPEPTERLRRASRLLEAGQVDVALAEVLRLPGRARAAAWIRKARLYADARSALDTIETAALLEPRAAPPRQASAPQEPPAQR